MDDEVLGIIQRLEKHMDSRFDRVEAMYDKYADKIELLKVETVKQQLQIDENKRDINNIDIKNDEQHKEFYNRLNDNDKIIAKSSVITSIITAIITAIITGISIKVFVK